MSSRFVVAAIVMLVGCGPKASTSVDEPIAATPVIGLADSSAPEGAPAVDEAAIGELSVEALEKLGGCWFESPYDFMFGGPASVQIGGGSYSRFTGGINGILYYGDLNECVAEHNGTKTASYSDNAPFAALAGVPLYSDQMDDTKPFGYFNPELIEWGHENLIPPVTASIAGVPVTKVYDVVFSRFFRMMTEAYLWIEQSGQYRREMDEYWEMAQKKNIYGVEWLQNKYSGLLPQYGVAWDGTAMTPQMAIGFWLRRGLDGTADELWLGLSKVMSRFDSAWYTGLATSYPSPDIVW